MKRAVFLCIATASLLLLGLTSAPLQADTQVNLKSGSASVAPGTGTGAGVPVTRGVGEGNGGGGGGGGTDEGDADGLSGIKNRPPEGASSNVALVRNSIFLELWWKFMILWAR